MARKKSSKKRSLHTVNEHFDTIFNAAIAEKMLRAKFSLCLIITSKILAMTDLNAELASQQCGNIPADNPALTQDQVSAYLKQLDPEWQAIENRAISFSYTFNNYYQTMAFVNIIAQIAHQQNHHPDLLVSYNRCTATYSTHSIGGLSVNDFICAAKINAAQKL